MAAPIVAGFVGPPAEVAAAMAAFLQLQLQQQQQHAPVYEVVPDSLQGSWEAAGESVGLSATDGSMAHEGTVGTLEQIHDCAAQIRFGS